MSAKVGKIKIKNRVVSGDDPGGRRGRKPETAFAQCTTNYYDSASKQTKQYRQRNWPEATDGKVFKKYFSKKTRSCQVAYRTVPF